MSYNGLGRHLGNLAWLSESETRSISKKGRFLPGQHDICSVAYWYQTLPAQPFPPLPDRNYLEII